MLSREYIKGRYLYGLLWYLSDRTWPEPNIVLLNNALSQTGWPGGGMTLDNWRKETTLRIRQYDWPMIVNDVRPFLERQEDLELLNKQIPIKLVGT